MAVMLPALRAGWPVTFTKIYGKHSAAGQIRLLEKSIHHIENPTHNLPDCGIVLQSTTISRVPLLNEI
jgi:hypothetical protein